jgi:hypothetical protein
MPTYVKQLFTDSGKEILGQVKWGQKVNCNYPGIYVVAITDSAEKIVRLLSHTIEHSRYPYELA